MYRARHRDCTETADCIMIVPEGIVESVASESESVSITINLHPYKGSKTRQEKMPFIPSTPVIGISVPNDTFLAHGPCRPGSPHVCAFNPFQPCLAHRPWPPPPPPTAPPSPASPLLRPARPRRAAARPPLQPAAGHAPPGVGRRRQLAPAQVNGRDPLSLSRGVRLLPMSLSLSLGTSRR